MLYTKRNAAISKNRRIDEATRRANAIPTLPLCVPDAAKTVRSAVLSVGLFGVEGNFPAHDKLHELRLAIGLDSRKKGQHSGNEWVACSTLADFNLDPTFECSKLVLKNIIFWAKKDPALAGVAWDLANCYQRASDANQPMRRLNGPGHAQWTTCQALGWKLQSDLKFTDTRGICYTLRTLSSSEIVDVLAAAWPDVVLTQLLKRKTQRTGCVLRGCHKGHRETLTGMLLGTHSSVEQRKRWQQSAQLLCPLCSLAEDTVMHTVLDCQKIALAREGWTDFLGRMSRNDELLFSFPSVPATHWDDVVAKVLWDLRLPTPSFTADCIGDRFCFTNGSCDVLHTCSHPVAAWSIALEAAATPTERAILGHLAVRDTQSVTSRCAVLQCGNVPRKQNVNRAEVSALAVFFRAHPSVTVYTDSQYAKTIIGAVVGNPDARMFHRAKNFDLISHICETFRETPARPRVRWIGSHQTPEQHFSPECNLAIIGNTVADTAANFARRCSPQDLLQPVMAARAEVRAHTDRCTKLMACVAELSKAKWVEQSKLAKQGPRGALAPEVDLPEVNYEHASRWVRAREALRRVGVGYLARDLPEVTPDLHPFLYRGVDYMRVLHAWVSSLTWPPAPVDRDPGINLVELWTNFRIVTQETVPVNTGTKNVPVYKTRRHDPALFLQAGDVDTVLRNFRNSLAALQKLNGSSLFFVNLCLTVPR